MKGFLVARDSSLWRVQEEQIIESETTVFFGTVDKPSAH